MIDFSAEIDVDYELPKTNPCEIYETLDRKSDKGPLREVQSAILNKWFQNYIDKKDVILKLHTGQGKTLVGLLILQSTINQKKGPALYLAPNKYLVRQICNQAQSFGIEYVEIGNDNRLPIEFRNGEKILITTVSKLFNGQSIFGLHGSSFKVSTLLMDDAHACAEIVKDTFKIIINRKEYNSLYLKILELFENDLKEQKEGSLSDIHAKSHETIMCVPYWSWIERSNQIVKLLVSHKQQKNIKYVWDLLKDRIKGCICIISGSKIEISPYLSPLDIFRSYSSAKQRIFMSATITNDESFIKDLDIDPKTVTEPLIYENEKWSGENMVLIPNLMSLTMTREKIISRIAPPNDKRSYGVFVLTPSKFHAKEWEQMGAKILDYKNIEAEIEKVYTERKFDHTIVLPNRYDGIDLPDEICRILVIDSKPHPATLIDKYIENCRSSSELIFLKTVLKIEQGMGRGLRGEKDYCAVILVGDDLVDFIQDKKTRDYFSEQTLTQIDIGLKIVKIANSSIQKLKGQKDILLQLLAKLIGRENDWKSFYMFSMDKISSYTNKKKVSHIYIAEKNAEICYLNEEYEKATGIIQQLLDENVFQDDDKGWYLQEMARYMYEFSKMRSLDLQKHAYKLNKTLFKSKKLLNADVLSKIEHSRVKKIIEWLQSKSDIQSLEDFTGYLRTNLTFKSSYDEFESALLELGKALGFESSRPDKDTDEGPDNLWKLKDKHYLLFECKNEKFIGNKISRDESGQMQTSMTWFENMYKECLYRPIWIVQTNKADNLIEIPNKIEVLEKEMLNKLLENYTNFIKEFLPLDVYNLTETRVQELLNIHKLAFNDFWTNYSKKVK